MFKDFYEKNRMEEDSGDIAIYESILPLLAEAADEDESSAEETKTSSAPKSKEDLEGKEFTLTSEGLTYLFKNPLNDNSDLMPNKATLFKLLTTDEAREEKSNGNLTTVIAVRFGNSCFKKIDDSTVAAPSDFFNAFTSDVKAKLSSSDLELFNKYFNIKASQIPSYGLTRAVPQTDAYTLLKALAKAGGTVKKQNSGPVRISLINVFIASEDHAYNLIMDKNDPVLSFDSVFTFDALYDGSKPYRMNKRGQEHEVYQVAGALFDAEQMLKNLKVWISKNPTEAKKKEEYDVDEQFTYIRDAYVSVLNDSDEFGTNSELAKENSKKFSPTDLVNALEYSSAVSKFTKEVTKFKKAYIVRKSITTYRKLEEEKLGYPEKTKHSTVDALICDINGGALINLLSEPTTKLKGHNGDGYVSVLKDDKEVARYYQISFKTKDTDSMGRAKGLLNSKGYAAAVNASDVYEESYAYEALMLAESIATRLSIAAQNGLDVLKKLGKETFSKMVKSASVLKKWGKTVIAKIKEASETRVMDYCFELYGLALTENATNHRDEITDYVSKIQESGKAVEYWERANEKILGMLKRIKSAPHAHHYRVYFNTPQTGNVTFESFVGQIYNFALLKTIEKLFLRSVDASQMEDYVQSLLDLYKEAIFGVTELPVWTIYRTSEDEIPYKYQGSRKTIDDNKSRMAANSTDIPLTVLKGENIKNGYHHFELYTLAQLVEDNGTFSPAYTKFAHIIKLPPQSDFTMIGLHQGKVVAE
jgi:F0F1-type ATP synthase epsilon subunit